MDEQEKLFYEYRTASHDISDHTLGIEGVDAETGAAVTFEAFRQVEVEGSELYVARYTTWNPEVNEMISEEVALPDRLHILGVNTLRTTVREKGRVITASGTIAVTLAIGTGLLVKRLHSTHRYTKENHSQSTD